MKSHTKETLLRIHIPINAFSGRFVSFLEKKRAFKEIYGKQHRAVEPLNTETLKWNHTSCCPAQFHFNQHAIPYPSSKKEVLSSSCVGLHALLVHLLVMHSLMMHSLMMHSLFVVHLLIMHFLVMHHLFMMHPLVVMLMVRRRTSTSVSEATRNQSCDAYTS
jgi:hypothetical protein